MTREPTREEQLRWLKAAVAEAGAPDPLGLTLDLYEYVGGIRTAKHAGRIVRAQLAGRPLPLRRPKERKRPAPPTEVQLIRRARHSVPRGAYVKARTRVCT